MSSSSLGELVLLALLTVLPQLALLFMVLRVACGRPSSAPLSTAQRAVTRPDADRAASA
ncbi:hypothetical protein [Nocardioides sp.]|uniref:hypothetical protein n=1 Tax=Nocardioides sp. TaxID=35761 RepID=UPI002ED5E801